GRVLTARGLDAIAPLPRRRAAGETRRLAPGRGMHGQTKAELVEVRQRKLALAQALAVALPGGAGPCDVAERVGALVAIFGRVARAAAADRIQHNDDPAPHPASPSRRG